MRGGALRPHARSLRDPWHDVSAVGVPSLPVTSGLVLYLRADLGITLNGGNVSAWADQSATATNFTQASSVNQPALSATGGPKASQPAIVFTAANSDFLTAAQAPTTGTDQTIFVVLKTTTTSGSQFFFQNGAAGSGLALAIGSTAGKRDVFVVGSGDGADGNATTAWEAWTVTTSNVGPAQVLRVNGAAQTLSASNMTMSTPGAGAGLGSPANGAGPYLDGRVWLLLEYSRVLSGAEIAQVEAWISQLTGIF